VRECQVFCYHDLVGLARGFKSLPSETQVVCVRNFRREKEWAKRSLMVWGKLRDARVDFGGIGEEGDMLGLMLIPRLGALREKGKKSIKRNPQKPRERRNSKGPMEYRDQS